jgi:hypothetical protein
MVKKDFVPNYHNARDLSYNLVNISCTHELTEFTKNIENFTYVLSILLHPCIKF